MRMIDRVIACPILLALLILAACRDRMVDRPTPVISSTPPATVVATAVPFVLLTPAPLPSVTPTPTRQPTTVPATASVRVTADIIPNVRFVSVRGAAPGGNATVVIHLSPSQLDMRYTYFWPSQCDLRYHGSDGVTRDAGKQRVPDDGTVTWMWIVDSAMPQGAGEVIADCGTTRATAMIDFR